MTTSMAGRTPHGRPRFKGFYGRRGKRILDLAVAIPALGVVSPVLAVVTCLVRVEMGRPVLFRQMRGGLNGQPFELIKIRTMTSALGPDGKPLPDRDRITPLGRALRAFSLDELPELWNVVRGDMSLVGPRPFLFEYMTYYNEREMRRHDVRPGITGLAQVEGRNGLSWEERFALDLEYVDSMSLRRDVALLVRTVLAVLSRRGVNQDELTTSDRFVGSVAGGIQEGTSGLQRSTVDSGAPREGALDVYWVNQTSGTPDQPGGTRHFDMASELVRQGARVTLVASDLSILSRTYARRRGPWDLRAHRETIAGVRLTWLSAGQYRNNDWRRLLSMVIFGAGVFVYLVGRKKHRGTVFIGSTPHLVGALGAFAAARMRRIPFVLEVRDLWPESYSAVTGRDGGVAVKIMGWTADLLYRQAAQIIVLAEGNVDVIAGRGTAYGKLHYVPNGVDLTRFPAASRTGPKDHRVTFAYVGAHGPANGLDVLLRACALLEATGNDDFRVILVGDGPAKEALVVESQALGIHTVEFRDPIPSGRVPELLSSVDVGLMLLAPAELFSYGVSPNKLFEYLAAGIPIVNNVPGAVAEMIQRAGAGESCPPGSPDALATAMTSVATALRTDSVRYRSGRSFIEQHHDRRLLAKEVEAILRQSLGQRGRARLLGRV